MWRHLASNTITFMIVGLAGAAGVIAWGVNEYSGEGPLETAMCLRVEPGTNMRAVSARLEEQGAIGSAPIFRIGAEYSEKAGQLKAGSHLIPEQSSMEEILDIVTRGGASTCGTEILYKIGVNAVAAEVRELDPATSSYTELAEFDPTAEGVEIPAEYETMRERADTRYRISMAEGVTSWQVVQALNAIDTLDGDVEEIPAEGSLAPDSYEIAPGTQVAAVLERMEAAQAAILAEAWENRAEGLPLETPEEALILASIVEKETGVAAERPQVASVFVNRLRQGMPLQTDPTVIYGITEGKGVLGRGLRRSELQAETPWNTYVINGLPPTPIANPGRAAIQAALNPASTDYVFFVADGTGGHAFSETLAEHNSNVAKWREIEAQRAAGN
ncbi:endolytic transglycosylase MltG [Limimaricola variabilis]|uniref:endolytic transglycosylase MltG n=1 Tax=Limimaricola variabilis TaxID=1492771 RepID=UPI002AC9C9C4|nr:endolytic transglycosylase MltG [Limimaricola variabilis]WPY95066.1 endolytic transglycosylase MltG [Limimaricola variabilis]